MKSRKSGFTIIELLIVLVVIAILAGIVIVAYGSIRRQAVESAISAEASSLKRQLDLKNVDGLPYPSSVGSLLNTSDNWKYQYTVNNTATPRYYCASFTSLYTKKTYYVSSSESLSEGLCDGHDAAGGDPDYKFENLTWGRLGSQPSSLVPSSLATSSNGSIVYVSYTNGPIFKSSDGGSSWSELTGAGVQSWRSLATSDDGRKVIAAGDGLSGSNRMAKISLDGGATWQSQDQLGPEHWQVVAVSGDGSRFMAGYEIGHLYTSSDDGASWLNITAQSSGRRWGTISMSRDGTKIYASSGCSSNSGFGMSSNGGGLFTFKTSAPNCAKRIVTSSDGQKAIMNGYSSPGNIQFTNDSGATWQAWDSIIAGSMYGYVGMSGDATKIMIDYYGFRAVKISKDGGLTWTTYSTNTGGTSAGDQPRDAIVSRDGSAFYTYTINGIFKGQFD